MSRGFVSRKDGGGRPCSGLWVLRQSSGRPVAQPKGGSDALLLTFHEPTLAAVGKTAGGMGGGGRGL